MKKNTKHFFVIVFIMMILTGCRTNSKAVKWDRILFSNEAGNDNWSFSRVELKLYDSLQDTSYRHLTYIGEDDIDVDKISIKFYIPDTNSEHTNIEIFMSSIEFKHIDNPNYLEHLEKGRIVGTAGSTSTQRELEDYCIDKVIIEIIYEKNGEVKKELFETEMEEL